MVINQLQHFLTGGTRGISSLLSERLAEQAKKASIIVPILFLRVQRAFKTPISLHVLVKYPESSYLQVAKVRKG